MSTEKSRKKPVAVTPEILEAAVEAVASGMTLSDFCRKPKRPVRRAIVKAIRDDKEWCERFEEARQHGYDVLAESCLKITDAPIPKGADASAEIRKRRLMVDTRLKLLAKWCTARYGEKLGVDHAGEVAISLSVVTGVPRGEEGESNGLPKGSPPDASRGEESRNGSDRLTDLLHDAQQVGLSDRLKKQVGVDPHPYPRPRTNR